MTYKLHCPDGQIIEFEQTEIDATIFALTQLCREIEKDFPAARDNTRYNLIKRAWAKFRQRLS